MTAVPSDPPPPNPLAAVVAADPTRYYRELATRPLHFDDRVGAWIAASYEDVVSVLGDPALGVRPAAEPVPPHLSGTAAGALFGLLVRMTDGPGQRRLKAAITDLFDAVTPERLDGACRRAAQDVPGAAELRGGELVERWMDAYPAAVVADLAGLTGPTMPVLDEVADAARHLAACFAPGAAPSTTTAASDAAMTLQDAAARATGGLAPALRADARVAGAAEADANVAGWFFQLFDSTAALIGTAVARAIAQPTPPSRAAIDGIIGDVLADDPPIHNTRRFVHRQTVVGGQQLDAGDVVLVVLAAAGHDPRRAGVCAFGDGPHRCPAAAIAPRIAAHAVAALCAPGSRAAGAVVDGFRPSLNARIPTFTSELAAARPADPVDGADGR